MLTAEIDTSKNTRVVIESLMTLVRSDKGVKEFWRQYMHHVAGLCDAGRALLIVRTGDQWRTLSCWPDFLAAWVVDEAMARLATTAQSEHHGLLRTPESTMLAVQLDVGPQEVPPVLLLDLGASAPKIPSDSTLLFIAATPSMFQVTRQYRQARADIIFFAEMMKLAGAITDDGAFRLAAMRLCNESAGLFKCSQVSLGWDAGQGMRVWAISHIDQFDQRAAAVQELETVMDECADQDAEILWPAPPSTNILTRAHAAYAEGQKIGALLSLPIRRDNRVVGLLCCERQQPFLEEEVWRLRLLLEQSARWLAILEERTSWFGRRWWRKARAWCAEQLNFNHAGWKVGAVAAVVVLCLLFLDFWPHAVHGTFLVKADEAVQIASPIDGYLQEALIEPGDVVEKGDQLLAFDARELLTEQSANLAKLARHYREAEKAKAGNALAEMRIALLMAKETEAELQRIAFFLENTQVTASLTGVVAEGDLRARIGAPVRKGDILLKIASLKQLSVRLSIAETDIADIAVGKEAELTFVGRPEQRFRATITKIVPSAAVDHNRNVFTAHAEIIGPAESWWRPGMSGTARVEAGRRSLWWLMSHDILDFLRLRFWI